MRITTPLVASAVLFGTAACGDTPEASGDTVETQTEPLASAALALLPGWDEIYPEAAGNAVATLSGGEMTLIVTLEGVEPEGEYMFHVHDTPCDAEPPGGGHWLADPEGEEVPDNEAGGPIATLDDGSGSIVLTTGNVIDERAKSVVVHAGNYTEHAGHVASDRILCGDFPER